MNLIGKRTSEEIRRTAAEHDVTITFELECLDIDRYSLYTWDHGKAAPSAKTLARMLKVGYDINYILLGVRA